MWHDLRTGPALEMMLSTAKTLFGLCLGLIAFAQARASCPVATVIVMGKVEQIGRHATVRVQLIYSKDEHEESAEATLDGNSFNITVEFLTQSRKPLLLGNLRERCDRRPKTVVVTLTEEGRQYDQLSLDVAREFKKTDPDTYTARSEIVLGAKP